MTDKGSQIRLSPDIAIKVVWKKQNRKENKKVIDELVNINTHKILAAYENYVAKISKEQ